MSWQAISWFCNCFVEVTRVLRYCKGPLRGHARSHREDVVLSLCAVPVGAGAPAKQAGRS
ncbi:hypothetical protein E8E78_12785 [Pseudomonas sp. BN505]|nr:hypothetical protein [Pseudomonas sp. BN605]MDH4857461.1 hypothetical protein [Pseudomonas sp. BN505]NTY91211.1 hypothetical protein [Pseudomonas putida]NTY99088.1 hypothetical protein [Pseudomonas putida]NTZ21457.1 hypothetical protein [Pseudomonas putida]